MASFLSWLRLDPTSFPRPGFVLCLVWLPRQPVWASCLATPVCSGWDRLPEIHASLLCALAACKDTPAEEPFAFCQAARERIKMPPAKKGKAKKAGKAKKTTVPDEEKYKKTELEVDTLKQYLVLRHDMARQAMADSEGLRRKLADLEKELEQARGDKKDIYEEMIRRYQQLQHQTDTRYSV
ncbi:coiled-coil domain-containing protein 153 isoform X2 [Anolis carolinensis]|uniref:coiled-coil domain-containing protein 153 isoform X2 n=1 Tax=Anolis carolinensis TaxID=28377 RepID=UPI002F2B7F5B